MGALARISDWLIPPLYRVAEGHGQVSSFAVRDRVQACLGFLSRVRASEARRAFEAASPATIPLDSQTLMQLLGEYRKTHTRADRRTPIEKSQARLNELVRRTGISRGMRALDIGCGDGSVTSLLAWKGVRTTGIDLVNQATPNALKSPARFLELDAHATGLPANSFDLIYSFDTLEHVDDPTKVLDEAVRLLAPGGTFYANFGPLYNSPHGAHQWASVDIPYAHLLFDADLLEKAAHTVGQRPMVKELNRWSLARWRNWTNQARSKLNVTVAIEKFNIAHVGLVTRFPDFIKREITHFDELVVRSIEIMGTKSR
jgi:2-polyprenyl-3-methyl-5-hydroxy-6-metoxy-1,4-benzoquinol methylase